MADPETTKYSYCAAVCRSKLIIIIILRFHEKHLQLPVVVASDLEICFLISHSCREVCDLLNHSTTVSTACRRQRRQMYSTATSSASRLFAQHIVIY